MKPKSRGWAKCGRTVHVLAVIFAVLSPGADVGQAAEYRAPRTAAGQPDLQGLWTNATATPLQRPRTFKAAVATEAEAAAWESSHVDAFISEGNDEVGSRPSEWFELGARMLRIGGQIRTSVVVDPPDGRFPYNPAGQARLLAERRATLTRFDGPEGRPAPERCLTGNAGSSGVPMLTGDYNPNYQIVQTTREVAIQIESSHGVRIIRLGAKHAVPTIRAFMGDSIGHWEGETLVVETVGFHPAESFKIPAPLYVSPDARVVERFTRIAPQEILYEFTVEDPTIFTRPWRGESLFTATKGPIFEYACHEGNYSLPGVLGGARVKEREAAGAADAPA